MHLAVRQDQPHQVDEDEATHGQQHHVDDERWPPQPRQPRRLPFQFLGLFPFCRSPRFRPDVPRRHERPPHFRQGKPCPRDQVDDQARDGKVMKRIVVVVQHRVIVVVDGTAGTSVRTSAARFPEVKTSCATAFLSHTPLNPRLLRRCKTRCSVNSRLTLRFTVALKNGGQLAGW